jgi:amidase/aspartyl-tRNA(Asn)/glutamyl-tRNA(Gln) amidotransferase subunit A
MCGSLPFGLQLTGPRYSDGWLLDLATAWEAAHPWPRQAPGYAPFTPGGLTDWSVGPGSA